MTQPNQQDRTQGYVLAGRVFLALYACMGITTVIVDASGIIRPPLLEFLLWPIAMKSFVALLVLAELAGVAWFVGHLKMQLAWHQRMQAGSLASWNPGMNARPVRAAAQAPAYADTGELYAKE